MSSLQVEQVERILNDWRENHIVATTIQPIGKTKKKPLQLVGFWFIVPGKSSTGKDLHVVSLLVIGINGSLKEELYVYDRQQPQLDRVRFSRDSQREGILFSSENIAAVRGDLKELSPFDLIAAKQICQSEMALLSGNVIDHIDEYYRRIIVAQD